MQILDGRFKGRDQISFLIKSVPKGSSCVSRKVAQRKRSGVEIQQQIDAAESNIQSSACSGPAQANSVSG
jgi:hypothetical protein